MEDFKEKRSAKIDKAFSFPEETTFRVSGTLCEAAARLVDHRRWCSAALLKSKCLRNTAEHLSVLSISPLPPSGSEGQFTILPSLF